MLVFGVIGIRTLGEDEPHTRFRVWLLRPLGHRSNEEHYPFISYVCQTLIDKWMNYHYVLKAIGWMAERSKAAVLKTVEVQASGGSNPSPSVLVYIGAVGFSRLD